MKRIVFVSTTISMLALLGAGCSQTTSTSKPLDQTSIEQTDQSLVNIFDPFKNKVGDSITGLKIVSITGVTNTDRQMASDNVIAKFSGQVMLSGTYGYSNNDFFGSEMVCFTVDTNERWKLPVLVGQLDQNTHFCFSNFEKAKTAFGPSYGQGQATITIDKYELWYAPAEVVNQAELLSVISKKPISLAK